MYLGVGLLGSSCLALCELPGSESLFSFPRLGKFSVIISSNIISTSCSVFSPFRIPVMQMSVCLILSHKSLKFTFFSFFLFAVLIRWVPLPCLRVDRSCLLLRLVCCWTPLVYLSVQLLCFSAPQLLFCTFLYFVSFVEFLTEFINSSPESGEFCFVFVFLPCCMACGILVPQPGIEPGPTAVKAPSPNHWTTRDLPGEHLYNHYFKLFLGKLIISVSLRFFPWVFFLVVSVGTYSSLSSFCFTLCVSFYTVNKITTSPSLEGVASCRRWILSFSPALAVRCLSNLCDYPSSLFCF